MRIRTKYQLFFLFITLALASGQESNSDQAAKEWFKTGLNLFKEQIDKSQKQVVNLTDVSSNKLKSLFFAGNDSQYIDVKGIALNSLDKTKEGLQAGQNHVKNLFFDGKDSQMIDVKDLASKGLEIGEDLTHKSADKIKDLFFKGNQSKVVDVKDLASQGLETSKESVEKIKDMFFNGEQSTVADIENLVERSKDLIKTVPEKTTSAVDKIVNWFKGIFG